MMAQEAEGQWVVPNPQIPRSFGLMNIIFGAILLLYGAGTAVWTMYAPVVFKGIQDQVKEQLEKQKARQQSEIAALKDKIKSAKTEEEKKDLESELQALESNEVPDATMFDDVMGAVTDPRILAYQYIELAAGMVLNIVMIISGIGLLLLAEWARRLAIGVAWLKIARWVAMIFATIFVVVPITTAKVQPVFRNIQMQASAKAGPGATSLVVAMTQAQAVITVVTVVGTALIAVVYPVCVIWFLTRPKARAACLAAKSPPAPRLDGEPPRP